MDKHDILDEVKIDTQIYLLNRIKDGNLSSNAVEALAKAYAYITSPSSK